MSTQIIKMKIHEESDLYSPLDPDRNILSEDIVSYLTRVFLSQHRKRHDNYTIEIISDTPLDEEHARAMIRRGFDQERDDIKYAVKRLTMKEVYLAIIGVVILSLWLYLSATMENVRVEILSIMGWVAIWEAFSIAIMQRPELLIQQENIYRLVNTEIRFRLAEGSQEKAEN